MVPAGYQGTVGGGGTEYAHPNNKVSFLTFSQILKLFQLNLIGKPPEVNKLLRSFGDQLELFTETQKVICYFFKFFFFIRVNRIKNRLKRNICLEKKIPPYTVRKVFGGFRYTIYICD